MDDGAFMPKKFANDKTTERLRSAIQIGTVGDSPKSFCTGEQGRQLLYELQKIYGALSAEERRQVKACMTSLPTQRSHE